MVLEGNEKIGLFTLAIPVTKYAEKRSIYYDDIPDIEQCFERVGISVDVPNECQIECNPRIFYDIC